jgi:hypothetical protein
VRFKNAAPFVRGFPEAQDDANRQFARLIDLVTRSSRSNQGTQPNTLPCRRLLAIVRSQISATPSANSAAAAPFDILQNFVSLETVNRERLRA